MKPNKHGSVTKTDKKYSEKPTILQPAQAKNTTVNTTTVPDLSIMSL